MMLTVGAKTTSLPLFLIVALVLDFVGDRRAVQPGQRGVECCGERERNRHRGRRSLAGTDGTVGVVDRRQVDARDAVGRTGMCVRAAADAGRVDTAEQRDLLVLAQDPEQQGGPGVGRQRRVTPGMGATAPGGMCGLSADSEQGRDQQRERPLEPAPARTGDHGLAFGWR
jgi:hypothetical protein